jgi:hypothetical protein
MQTGLEIGRTTYDYIGTDISIEKSAELKEFNGRYATTQESKDDTIETKKQDVEVKTENKFSVAENKEQKVSDITEPQKQAKLGHIMGHNVITNIPTQEVMRLMSSKG